MQQIFGTSSDLWCSFFIEMFIAAMLSLCLIVSKIWTIGELPCAELYNNIVCWVWKRPHETVWQYWPGVSWLWNPFKSRNDIQMGNTDTQYSTSCRYTRKCQNQWYLGHLRPSASRKDCCVCRLILVASSLCFWHWQWFGHVKFQDCQTYVTLHPSTLEPNN